MAALDLSSCPPEKIDSALDRLPHEAQLDSIVAFLQKIQTVSAEQDELCEKGEAVQTFVEKKDLSRLVKERDGSNTLRFLEQILESFRRRRSEKERDTWLRKIREESTWEGFPDHLPESLRVRKNGKHTEFGINMLGKWCKVAQLTSFDSAEDFFMKQGKTGCISGDRLEDAIEYFRSKKGHGLREAGRRSRRLRRLNDAEISSLPPDRSALANNRPKKRRRLSLQNEGSASPRGSELNDVEVASEATTSMEPASGDCVSDDIHFDGSGEHANGNNGHMSSRVATASPSIEKGRARRRSESLDFDSEPSAPVHHIWSDSEQTSPEEIAISSDPDFAGARFLQSHLSIRESFPPGFEPSEICNKNLPLYICGIMKLLEFSDHELDEVECKKQSTFNKCQENTKVLRDYESNISAKKVELEELRSECASTAFNGVKKFARLHQVLERDLVKQIEESQDKLQNLKDSVAKSNADHQRSTSALEEVLAPYQDPTFEHELLDRIIISAWKISQRLMTYQEENDIPRRTADTHVTG